MEIVPFFFFYFDSLPQERILRRLHNCFSELCPHKSTSVRAKLVLCVCASTSVWLHDSNWEGFSHIMVLMSHNAEP